jgi:hypothetical protein
MSWYLVPFIKVIFIATQWSFSAHQIVFQNFFQFAWDFFPKTIFFHRINCVFIVEFPTLACIFSNFTTNFQKHSFPVLFLNRFDWPPRIFCFFLSAVFASYPNFRRTIYFTILTLIYPKIVFRFYFTVPKLFPYS